MSALMSCFHCHEPVPEGTQFVVHFDNQPQHCCCPGCQAVAETILAQGLADYYRFRTAPAQKAELVPASLQQQLKNFDEPSVLADISQPCSRGQQIELSISGMSCAACAWLIERQLQQEAAIQAVSVNSSTARCQLIWQPDQKPLSEIIQQINALGYQATPFMADQEETQFTEEMQGYLKRLAVSGIMSMQVMMLAFGLYFGDYTGIEQQYEGYLRWISLLLTLPVVLFAAHPFTSSAIRSIKARALNMDVPITLALYYTFLASCYATWFDTGEVYFESVCMFTFLLQLGKFFEFRARKQARDATSNLLKIMPVTARIWHDGTLTPIAARLLTAGTIIQVLPGETFPADGVIVEGDSSADESMLTGEYRAILKTKGDAVLAGSVNHDGVLLVEVTASLSSSRLGQIIVLQQETLHQKPKILEKTDRIARFFIERLLVVATATFIVWYFWIDADRAFWVTLSVLVATCPCALSLATPTAITCTLARLNRRGILIKNQQVLEFLPKLNHVFLDKTGTLTAGSFSIVDTKITPLNALQPPIASHALNTTIATWQADDFLALMAKLEQWSEHPIAKAFAPYNTHNAKVAQLELMDITVVPGAGITAKAYWRPSVAAPDVAIPDEAIPDVDGNTVVRLDEQLPALCLALGNSRLTGHPLQAGYHVMLAINGQVAAQVQLADAIRPEAKTAVQQLHQQQIKLTMLTGDASAAVTQVADQLDIRERVSGCLPEDKVATIQNAVHRGDTVLMIGDGINDSPSFHAAHVSVALDTGTDLSKNQADVVLLHNRLTGIADLIDGAKQGQRVVKQNLAWSVGYNLIIIPLAVCGFVSPYIAVIGMSFSSLLVVSNSLRLLKHRD